MATQAKCVASTPTTTPTGWPAVFSRRARRRASALLGGGAAIAAWLGMVAAPLGFVALGEQWYALPVLAGRPDAEGTHLRHELLEQLGVGHQGGEAVMVEAVAHVGVPDGEV